MWGWAWLAFEISYSNADIGMRKKNGCRPIDYGHNALSTPRYVISGARAGNVHARQVSTLKAFVVYPDDCTVPLRRAQRVL